MEQQRISINLNQLEHYKCNLCQSTSFALNSVLKHVPFTMSPTGKATAVLQQVGFRCCNCNTKFGLDLVKEVIDGRLSLVKVEDEAKPKLGLVKDES